MQFKIGILARVLLSEKQRVQDRCYSYQSPVYPDTAGDHEEIGTRFTDPSFPYVPGRKGWLSLGQGCNPVWFQDSAESMEGLEERPPGDLGEAL